MSWQETVTQTVTGLGFDLVDLERSAGGLLRVTIDLPWEPGGAEERFVTVEGTVVRANQESRGGGGGGCCWCAAGQVGDDGRRRPRSEAGALGGRFDHAAPAAC